MKTTNRRRLPYLTNATPSSSTKGELANVWRRICGGRGWRGCWRSSTHPWSQSGVVHCQLATNRRQALGDVLDSERDTKLGTECFRDDKTVYVTDSKGAMECLTLLVVSTPKMTDSYEIISISCYRLITIDSNSLEPCPKAPPTCTCTLHPDKWTLGMCHFTVFQLVRY